MAKTLKESRPKTLKLAVPRTISTAAMHEALPVVWEHPMKIACRLLPATLLVMKALILTFALAFGANCNGAIVVFRQIIGEVGTGPIAPFTLAVGGYTVIDLDSGVITMIITWRNRYGFGPPKEFLIGPAKFAVDHFPGAEHQQYTAWTCSTNYQDIVDTITLKGRDTKGLNIGDLTRARWNVPRALTSLEHFQRISEYTHELFHVEASGVLLLDIGRTRRLNAQGIDSDGAISELTQGLIDHGYWNAAWPYLQ